MNTAGKGEKAQTMASMACNVTPRQYLVTVTCRLVPYGIGCEGGLPRNSCEFDASPTP